MKDDELNKRIKNLKYYYKIISNDPWCGEDLAHPYKQLIEWLEELQNRRTTNEK